MSDIDFSSTNPKNQLQELYQKRKLALPKYKTVRCGGPDHKPLWTSTVTLHCGTKHTSNICPTKSDAELSAAIKALETTLSRQTESPPVNNYSIMNTNSDIKLVVRSNNSPKPIITTPSINLKPNIINTPSINVNPNSINTPSINLNPKSINTPSINRRSINTPALNVNPDSINTPSINVLRDTSPNISKNSFSANLVNVSHDSINTSPNNVSNSNEITPSLNISNNSDLTNPINFGSTSGSIPKFFFTKNNTSGNIIPIGQKIIPTVNTNQCIVSNIAEHTRSVSPSVPNKSFGRAAVLVDIENMPKFIDDIKDMSFRPKYTSVTIYAFVGEHHCLVDKDFPEYVIKIISPSTRPDGTDSCIQVYTGMLLAREEYDTYLIATRDHFGSALVEMIMTSNLGWNNKYAKVVTKPAHI